LPFFDTKPRDWLGERLRNDPFCVEWDVKPPLCQSTTVRKHYVGALVTLWDIECRFPHLHYQRLPLGCQLVTSMKTTIVLRPFFRDHSAEPVPEANSWTLWCKGRLTGRHSDHPAGHHSIPTNQCPPPSPQRGIVHWKWFNALYIWWGRSKQGCWMVRSQVSGWPSECWWP